MWGVEDNRQSVTELFPQSFNIAFSVTQVLQLRFFQVAMKQGKTLYSNTLCTLHPAMLLNNCPIAETHLCHRWDTTDWNGLQI